MKNVRNVTIKCDAEKLCELLELLDVEYVEEITITRTPSEFEEDYQEKTPIGLLDEDEDFEEPTWGLLLPDFDDDPIGEDYEAFIDDLITKASKLGDDFEEEDDDEWDFIWDNQEGYYESDVR